MINTEELNAFADWSQCPTYPASFAETAKIIPGRLLEDAKVEHRYDRQNMIENIGLDSLIIDPILITAENINLNRQTVLAGRQLPDQESHILVNHRVMPQI